MTMAELEDVQSAHESSGKHLMVGFNRRFAPQVQTMKKLLGAVATLQRAELEMRAGGLDPGDASGSGGAGAGTDPPP